LNTVKEIWGRHLGPALLIGVLALFFSVQVASGQTVTDLPPPPPPPTPKPTPTPKPPSDEDFEVIRTTSNLVMVPVAVVDNKGQPFRGLQIADFRLEEEGRPQEIAQIGDPDEVPLEIAILIDISGSIHTRFEFEKEAAARFLQTVLKANDRANIFVIDRTPLVRQTGASAANASSSLLSLQPAADKGPTAFYDTVVEAAQYLFEKASPRHRRVMLVISDGVDNFSDRIKKAIGTTSTEQDSVAQDVKLRVYNRAIAEVQREVQKSDSVFYSINPSGNTMHLNVITRRGQEGLQRLAESTGGTAFVPEKIEDLTLVFDQIAAELRAQYLLQYYSNNQAAGKQFRRISVAVPGQPQLRVRSRQGYYPKQGRGESTSEAKKATP
jgi:Ca-activated chloride channel family protein